MKYRVDQLEGALLDAAVAKAEGAELLTASGAPRSRLLILDGGYVFEPRVEMDAWSPSTKWEHGGPIIERQRIILLPPDGEWDKGIWTAGTEAYYNWEVRGKQVGPTGHGSL